MTELSLAGTIPESIVDGPGIRYALFVQGCPHHCPGCHNPQTHAFEGGRITSVDAAREDILTRRYIKALTLSGGEPFCQAEALYELVKPLKEQGFHLMCYSGYTFEELLGKPEVMPLLSQLDLLVDGRFVEAEKNIDLRFRGSANQRVLDVPASLAAKAPVWCEKYR